MEFPNTRGFNDKKTVSGWRNARKASAKTTLAPVVVPIDVALARAAAIVGHVHKGAVACALAEALESHGSRSTEHIKLPCPTALLEQPEASEGEYTASLTLPIIGRRYTFGNSSLTYSKKQILDS